jgi:excisionase family DNA binding protein
MIPTPVAASLDLEEAAAFLGLHPDTLRERAAAGTIPGAKIGKEWRFLDVDLADYLRRNYGGRACRSTSAERLGGSTYATAGEELDALLGPQIEPLPSDSTTNLRLVSGKSGRPAASSPTPSSRGSRRNREAAPK